VDPKLDKYNKEYFETIMKQDRGIAGWTFSDILGLAVSEISEGAISPTNSEDLNTKSSASTVTSPRSPQPANGVTSGSDAASSSIPLAAASPEGKTTVPEENKKTLKREHKSPRSPKTRKSELHLKKTKTKPSQKRERKERKYRIFSLFLVSGRNFFLIKV